MNKKILILTMCCNLSLFINQEYNIRHKLYGKDIIENKYENVEYLTYTASTDGKYHYNKNLHKLEVPCDDSLQGTYDKTIKAFKLIKQLGIEFDYIFRTNCSTYVNVQALQKFVNSIDTKYIYSGGIYCTPNGTGPYEWSFYGVGNSLLIPKFWVNILITKNINEYKGINKVKSESESYYNIDDNAIGFVINSYNMTFDDRLGRSHDDVYETWQSFKIPQINTIPSDPYNYIAIPFREYTPDNTRQYEELASMAIHEAMKNADIANIPVDTYKSNTVHIIDFDKQKRAIVSRQFAEQFVHIMSDYKLT